MKTQIGDNPACVVNMPYSYHVHTTWQLIPLKPRLGWMKLVARDDNDDIRISVLAGFRSTSLVKLARYDKYLVQLIFKAMNGAIPYDHTTTGIIKRMTIANFEVKVFGNETEDQLTVHHFINGFQADKCQHLRASLIFPELKEVVRGFGADYNPDGTIFDSNTR